MSFDYGNLMNGVAHYIVGVLITLAIIKWRSSEDFDFSYLNIILIIVVAFFSHMFVDAVAHFTYHPSDSNWSDPFYMVWHLSTYVAEAGFAIYFLRVDIRYSIGMLSSVGFDLWDWSIRRPLIKHADIELPGIHWLADATQQILFEWWAPSLRYEQWAILVEIAFVVFLFYFWRKWHITSKFAENKRHATWLEVLILVIIFGSLRLLTLI